MADLLTYTFGITHITEKLFTQNRIVRLFFIFTVGTTRSVTTPKSGDKPPRNSQKTICIYKFKKKIAIDFITLVILPSGNLASLIAVKLEG